MAIVFQLLKCGDSVNQDTWVGASGVQITEVSSTVDKIQKLHISVGLTQSHLNNKLIDCLYFVGTFSNKA